MIIIIIIITPFLHCGWLTSEIWYSCVALDKNWSGHLKKFDPKFRVELQLKHKTTLPLAQTPPKLVQAHKLPRLRTTGRLARQFLNGCTVPNYTIWQTRLQLGPVCSKFRMVLWFVVISEEHREVSKCFQQQPTTRYWKRSGARVLRHDVYISKRTNSNHP